LFVNIPSVQILMPHPLSGKLSMITFGQNHYIYDRIMNKHFLREQNFFTLSQNASSA
jgi:hypothetical protein